MVGYIGYLFIEWHSGSIQHTRHYGSSCVNYTASKAYREKGIDYFDTSALRFHVFAEAFQFQKILGTTVPDINVRGTPVTPTIAMKDARGALHTTRFGAK